MDGLKSKQTNYKIFSVITLKGSGKGQKQPPEVFYEKSCFKNFCNIHRKTPLLELLFNKIGGLKDWNFITKKLQFMCFSVNIACILKPSFNSKSEWLLLKGRYRFSTDEILKFYHRDIMGISPFSFSWCFFYEGSFVWLWIILIRIA